jgi:hypothetical protein
LVSSRSSRSQADPRVGLLVIVAGLSGFLRPGPTEPKNPFSGRPAVLAALVHVPGFVMMREPSIASPAAEQRRSDSPP